MKQIDFDACIKKTFDKKVNRDATPKGESFMKYYSMNDAEKEVFLGGTCNGSTWRDEIMPLLDAAKVDYFNPVVEDWTSKDQIAEEAAKLRCGVHLYLITPKMAGVYSIAEVIKSAMINPKGTIFAVINDDDNLSFNSAEFKSIDAVAKLVMSLGATSWLVQNDLPKLVDHIKNIKRGFASTLIVQIQSHPIKYGGVHGVQVTYDFINLARSIIQFFNDKIGSVFNMSAIKSLKDAKESQEGRTDDRKARKVEGYDKD